MWFSSLTVDLYWHLYVSYKMKSRRYIFKNLLIVTPCCNQFCFNPNIILNNFVIAKGCFSFPSWEYPFFIDDDVIKLDFIIDGYFWGVIVSVATTWWIIDGISIRFLFESASVVSKKEFALFLSYPEAFLLISLKKATSFDVSLLMVFFLKAASFWCPVPFGAIFEPLLSFL